MHTRAHARFHRDRIIAKRVKQYQRFADDWDLRIFEQAGRAAPRGAQADEQQWLGCRRAHCGVCHPHKRWKYGDRQRAKREWRQIEDRAW